MIQNSKLINSKRKQDERESKAEAASQYRGYKRFKPNLELTEEDKERAKILKFLTKVANLLGKEAFDRFKESFKTYKTDAHFSIDEYCKSLTDAFFGFKDPICHLEVTNYTIRK
jgi:hypothetical protein